MNYKKKCIVCVKLIKNWRSVLFFAPEQVLSLLSDNNLFYISKIFRRQLLSENFYYIRAPAGGAFLHLYFRRKKMIEFKLYVKFNTNLMYSYKRKETCHSE